MIPVTPGKKSGLDGADRNVNLRSLHLHGKTWSLNGGAPGYPPLLAEALVIASSLDAYALAAEAVTVNFGIYRSPVQGGKAICCGVVGHRM